MPESHLVAFLMPLIGVLITHVQFEVNAQPTVDDNALCESSSFEHFGEAMNLIRKELKDVKNVCTSSRPPTHVQGCPPTETSSAKQVLVSAFLCKYRTRATRLRSVETCSVYSSPLSLGVKLSQLGGLGR